MDLKLNRDMTLAWPPVFIEGRELALQRVLIRLATLKGQWPYDTEAGLDVKTWVTENTSEDVILTQVIEEVATTPGIRALADATLTRGPRGELTITGTIVFDDDDPATTTLLLPVTPLQDGPPLPFIGVSTIL